MHSSLPAAERYFDQLNLDERQEGYFVVKNEADERIILTTARILHIGDEYIDTSNLHYRIVRITDDIAWARLVKDKKSFSLPLRLTGRGAEDNHLREEDVAPVESSRPKKIAVYHSHGAVSYTHLDVYKRQG